MSCHRVKRCPLRGACRVGCRVLARTGTRKNRCVRLAFSVGCEVAFSLPVGTNFESSVRSQLNRVSFGGLSTLERYIFTSLCDGRFQMTLLSAVVFPRSGIVDLCHARGMDIM